MAPDAVRARGLVPEGVEMVVFESENHGLSRGGRPGNRIEWLRRIIGWFDRHLTERPLDGVGRRASA